MAIKLPGGRASNGLYSEMIAATRTRPGVVNINEA
jgi:hypothetical protein